MIKKEKIIIKNKDFSYIWRRSRRARYMRLAVYPEGRVVVTTPFYFPEYLMKKGLERKMDWLREKILLLGRLPKKVSLSQSRERYLKHKNQALTLAKNRIEYFNRVYNFSYKKYAKELIKSAKKGIKITLILDGKKYKENKDFTNELKNNGIKVFIAKEKMHMKVAIFDNNTLIIGSSNWTKESFEENHESILITDDKKIILELANHLKKL